MYRSVHTLPIVLSMFVPALQGCIQPRPDVSGGSVLAIEKPTPPPPTEEKPWECVLSNDKPCAAPRSRTWVPGWITTAIAARGNKVAFVAYATHPRGGANYSVARSLGQISLDKGTLDWVVPLGTSPDDVSSIYDVTVAPNGDIIVGVRGYGELLLGKVIGQSDGFVASFDSSGNQRFAQRLEIFDTEPPPNERPQLINLRLIANDTIFVQTAFHVTRPNQPTMTPIHLFAFKLNGPRIFRKEVPDSGRAYNGTMWPVPDGTMWVKPFPGTFRRYSKLGEVLDSFDLPPDVEMRGFGAMNAQTTLINLTTKGMTNELHRFDLDAPLKLLFSEPTARQFHAGTVEHSPNFTKTYFVSIGHDGRSNRIEPIDANGQRGPATTVHNVSTRIGLLDNGDGVFGRVLDTGTEFIVQPL